MNLAEKILRAKADYDAVYEAGKAAGGGVVDHDPIPVTATGVRCVSVNDVSEIPHNVAVQLSSDTVTDFTGVTVTRVGKNLIDNNKFFNVDNWINCGDYGCSHRKNGWFTLNLKGGATYTISYTGTFNTIAQLLYFNKGEPLDYNNGETNVCYLYLSGNSVNRHTFTAKENADYYIFAANVFADTNYFGTVSGIQLELGIVASPYEPFTGEVYSANADGSVDGVTSLPLNMTVFADADTSLSVGYNKSNGFQAAYDFFWDIYQDNGNRIDYSDAFRGRFAWTDEIFKPKYPIIPTRTASYMFYGAANLTTLKHVSFDVSKATNLSYAFCTSGFHELPVIDMRCVPSTTRMTSVFFGMKNCTKIEKVYLHGGLLGDSFSRLSKLVEIRTEGEFVENLDIHWSPLSRASIESIMSSLSDNVTGQTATFNKAAVNAAFETVEGANDGSTSEAWTALIATKPNWTIGLA